MSNRDEKNMTDKIKAKASEVAGKAQGQLNKQAKQVQDKTREQNNHEQTRATDNQDRNPNR